MSNLEIAELYSILQEICVMVDKFEVKTETLRMETEHAIGNLREVEYLLYRTVSLLGRLGLPPDIDKAIQIIQRMILTIRMLHTTLIFAQMGTPYGWALAAISLATTGITAVTIGGDLVMEVTSH